MHPNERGALGGTGEAAGRAIGGAARAVVTFVGAVIVGFAIPAGWLRVGAEIQANSGKGAQTFLAIMVIFIGIVGSYFLIIAGAGIVGSWRRGEDADDPPPRRWNWNRSLSAERKRAPTLNRLESVFVWTAILVGMAYMVWFFFFAGSSLPS